MENQFNSTNLLRAISLTLAVTVLWLAQSLLVPVVFAVLMSLILIPTTRRLVQMGLPNLMATSITVGGISLVAISLILMTSNQMLSFVRQLPEYRGNLVERVRTVKSSANSSLADIHNTIDTLNKEISQEQGSATQPTTKPVIVTVAPDSSDYFSLAETWITPVLTPAGAIGMVILMSFFMVLSRDQLRVKSDRIWRRLGVFDADVQLETAVDTVSRYLRMQLLVNAIYGVLLALTLWLFGIPGALMWGLIGGMLRYIPYVGPLIGILAPTFIALATQPGWVTPLSVLGALGLLEFVTNCVLEPLIYGNATGVSSLGVILSTIFWGWLWGAPGLLLGMPITVCLVVVGKHSRSLRTIAEFLEAEPEPTPATPDSIVIASSLV